MNRSNNKSNRNNKENRDTWIEYGKEEGENWIKNLANDDAIRVAVNSSDFNDAEESLNRQDDYQYDYFKNNFPYAFRENMAAARTNENWDWNCKEYQFFKQGWIEAVKEFGEDMGNIKS